MIVDMDLISEKFMRAEDCNISREAPTFVYTRRELLDLVQGSKFGIKHDIPKEILRRRHHGIRAGVKRNKKSRERVWKETFKPALPSITMGNVCCLTNKLEELETLVRSQKMYRESSLICLTESWLTDNIPDLLTSFTGFRTIRADRNAE